MSGLRKMMYGSFAVTPPDGLIMLTNWNIQNLSITNGNDFTPTDGNALAWSPSYIPSGGVGIIQARSHISIFGLGPNPDFSQYSNIDYAVYMAPNGHPMTINNNNGIDYGSDVGSDPLLMRIRTDGLLVHQEFSTDDGSTWTHVMPAVTQPSDPLYPKIATDPGEYLNDVLVSGFTNP